MKSNLILIVLLTIISLVSCSNLEDEVVTDRHLEKGRFDSSKWDRAAYD